MFDHKDQFSVEGDEESTRVTGSAENLMPQHEDQFSFEEHGGPTTAREGSRSNQESMKEMAIPTKPQELPGTSRGCGRGPEFKQQVQCSRRSGENIHNAEEERPAPADVRDLEAPCTDTQHWITVVDKKGREAAKAMRTKKGLFYVFWVAIFLAVVVALFTSGMMCLSTRCMS